MKNFDFWKNLHDNQDLELFSNDETGLLWLKIKSIARKELMVGFLNKYGIHLKEATLSKQFAELFDLLSTDTIGSHSILDKYIIEEYSKQVSEGNWEQLVSELYKLKNFNWGGDYQNSLDKYLVSRYVKTFRSYDSLISKFDSEINVAVQGYVLNSWYNHWSSILIEYVFKSHPAVLPTVGQIKGVDFFINNIPFDLKVTYLPVEYIKVKRKEKGFPPELVYLKNKAKEAGIPFDKNGKPGNIMYEIIEKMKDRNDEFCQRTLMSLKNESLEILHEAQSQPSVLATWLYENQGEMRFGSENRLFIVLVDSEDFASSWKLKRNLELLRPKIMTYLDGFANKKVEELKLKFTFSGKAKVYSALADIIFIVR